MTTPSVLPAGFVGNSSDFAKCKVDRSGALRLQAFSTPVPSLSAIGVIIGLIPFQAGARVQIDDKSVYTDNIGGATTTLNLGYVYDDNVSFTNDLDAWSSLNTAAQAGGFVTVDEKEGLTFVAQGNGWIVAQIAGLATDTLGNIFGQVCVAYDA